MGNKDIQSYRTDTQKRGATEKLRPFSLKKKKKSLRGSMVEACKIISGKVKVNRNVLFHCLFQY